MTFSDTQSYYSEDGGMTVKSMVERSYRDSITLFQQFWNEADIDTRFVNGDQTLWQQIYGVTTLDNRRQFQFNHLRRVRNMISGFQRRNRKSTIVTPIHESDQQGADDFSELIQWVNTKENVYFTISDAFEGALTTGLNMLSVWLDYRLDPINGEIKVDNLYYNNIIIDPTFKKQDFSDAAYIWTRRWMNKMQIVQLLPEKEEEIMSMPYSANRDDKFIFLPENYQYGLRNLLPYDEYWYQDVRKVTLLVDTESGETSEWSGDKESLKMFLEMNSGIHTVAINKPTVKLAILVGNRVMYDGPNPYGTDSYPFVGTFCYFEPTIPYFTMKIQGVIRGARDAQYLFNRKKVIECDILESQINSGIKYKESALIDPNDAFLNGQGRALAIRDSASMDDVQVMQPPRIDASMMELTKSLAGEIHDIIGVTEELLGAASDEKSGLQTMLRQGAGLTTLQGVFDMLDMTQKLLGEKFIELIQANWGIGKVRQILGKDPSPEFSNKLFGKYHCNVEEGNMTTSQKQTEFEQLIRLRDLGINIPESILIEKAQLQGKQDLIDALEEQSKQSNQIQEAQMKAQMEQTEAVTLSLQAKAEADMAMSQERISNVGLKAAENYEKLTRAQEERDMGALAKVRAAKELEEMDLSHLQKLLGMLATIQQHSKNEVDAQMQQSTAMQNQNQSREPQNLSNLQKVLSAQ